jgi:polysaccharide export outer membrane protein
MRAFMMALPILLLFSLACSSSYPKNCSLLDCAAFRAESAYIRQGKAAIQVLEGKEVACLPADALQEYQDRIAEEDLLNIVLYHPSRRDLMESVQAINQTMGGFPVVEGCVTLPCLSPVSVIGLTLAEAKQELTQQLQKEIAETQVFLSYRQRLCQKVEIAGMVQRGNIPVNGRVRLYEILAEAHLPPNANLYASYVARDGAFLNIDLYKLLHQGDMSQNIVMHGGDKIFIASPADGVALIMGEVRAPRALPLPYGTLPLREALAWAGGIMYTGNLENILIIRGGMEFPKIYVISWREALHQPNQDLLLIPGDIVFVSQKPITQWNLFISQLRSTLLLIPAWQLFRQATR